MAILERLLAPRIQAVEPSPADDFWYGPAPSTSVTGINVTAESALTISTVYACVSAIAQDIAAMPLHMYRRLSNGGKERAPNHPLYDLLRHQPNEWQTAFEYWETQVALALLRGNAYSQIVEGPRGFADQLIPLNPARMKVEQLEDDRLRYTYTRENGRPDVFSQEEIFHLRGLGSDGISGLSIVSLAREAMGLAKATEEYGGRFFGQSAEPRGVLQLDGRLSDEGFERLKENWHQVHGGLGGAHKVAILENGVKWQQVGLSNEDSQFLDSRKFQVEEVARWFKVPLQRIGHTERQTTWGTGLEQFNIAYIAYTLLPWLRRIEQQIRMDLVLAPQTFFAEFLMDHLLRGDTTARYTAYGMAIRDGWMNRNEVREKENMNPVEGLDDFLAPQNMAVVDEEGNIQPLSEPPRPEAPNLVPMEEEEPDARAVLFATHLAAIAVRREMTRLDWANKRHRDAPDEWDRTMDAFYRQHEDLLSKDLGISQEKARKYCQYQRANPNIAEEDRIRQLTRLALGGNHANAHA